jgi:hypothetical protein
MTPATKRRKRRRLKAILKMGKKAVRKHKRLSGRTGAIMSKRTPKRIAGYVSHVPNPEPSIMALGGPLF